MPGPQKKRVLSALLFRSVFCIIFWQNIVVVLQAHVRLVKEASKFYAVFRIPNWTQMLKLDMLYIGRSGA